MCLCCCNVQWQYKACRAAEFLVSRKRSWQIAWRKDGDAALGNVIIYATARNKNCATPYAQMVLPQSIAGPYSSDAGLLQSKLQRKLQPQQGRGTLDGLSSLSLHWLLQVLPRKVTKVPARILLTAKASFNGPHGPSCSTSHSTMEPTCGKGIEPGTGKKRAIEVAQLRSLGCSTKASVAVFCFSLKCGIYCTGKVWIVTK